MKMLTIVKWIVYGMLGLLVLTAGWVFFRTIVSPTLNEDMMTPIVNHDRKLIQQNLDLLSDRNVLRNRGLCLLQDTVGWHRGHSLSRRDSIVLSKLNSTLWNDTVAWNNFKSNLLNDTAVWKILSLYERGLMIEQLLVTESRLVAQNADYLADLRQESNNNINKTNGWMAFWLAILGLGSIGLAIMQEMKNKHSLKETIEAMEGKQNSIKAEFKEQSAEYNKMQYWFNDEKNKYEQILTRMQDEMQSIMMRARLQLHANNLRIRLDNSLLGESPNRERHMIEAWRRGWDLFDRMIEIYIALLKDRPGVDRHAVDKRYDNRDTVREVLCEALVMLYDMWIRMYLRWPYDEKPFDDFEIKLKDAIKDIHNAPVGGDDLLFESLKELGKKARERIP